MPKTRADLLRVLCDKLGGEKGEALRAQLDRLVAAGKFGPWPDKEYTDDEFTAALQTMERQLAVTREWAGWPPVATWDRRN